MQSDGISSEIIDSGLVYGRIVFQGNSWKCAGTVIQVHPFTQSTTKRYETKRFFYLEYGNVCSSFSSSHVGLLMGQSPKFLPPH